MIFYYMKYYYYLAGGGGWIDYHCRPRSIYNIKTQIWQKIDQRTKCNIFGKEKMEA